MEHMAEDTLGTDTPATVSVPDKPALEGLEERLDARWRAEGTYKFNPQTTREQVYSIDTPPPTASGSLHVGHMFSYTQTDVLARYQRMQRQERLLPDGLGRQRPAHRTPRAELLRRALRPDLLLRRGLPPAGHPGEEPARLGRRLPQELHRAVRGTCRRGREGLRAPLLHPGPVRRLGPDLPHHRRRVALGVPARLPGEPERRRRLHVRGTDAVGRHVPHRRGPGRARGPRDAGRVLPLPVHRGRRHADLHRDHPPGTAGGLRRPGREPGRRALQAALRQDRHLPALRRARHRVPARRWPRPTRARASRWSAPSAT